MANVFLSYKRERKQELQKVVECFERAGLTVYWDARLRASADYIQQLNSELLKADCVVVAWCEKSIQSPWVIAECLKAFERRVLLPIKIRNIANDSIPSPFNIIHTFDLHSWSGDELAPDWLELLSDIRHLIDKPPAAPEVSVDIATDEDAMSDELYSSVKEAQGGVGLLEREPATEFKTSEVRDFVVSYLRKTARPVAQATLADQLKARWPSVTGQYNWFGHTRFSTFFKSLELEGYRLDTNPPGIIYSVGSSTPRPTTVSEATEPEPGDEMVGHLKTVGAPVVDPKTYRAIITKISEAVNEGCNTLTSISSTARDKLRSEGENIGREKVSFVAKGALIGGLDLNRLPLRPSHVALCFASSVFALCASKSIELDLAQQDALLEAIGFPDL